MHEASDLSCFVVMFVSFVSYNIHCCKYSVFFWRYPMRIFKKHTSKCCFLFSKVRPVKGVFVYSKTILMCSKASMAEFLSIRTF